MYPRLATRLSAAALLTLAACGGGGTTTSPPPPPPPPPPPAPVASVVVAPAAATLVPTQTQALTATPRDASGNTLAGRTVTWSSNAGAVASVSTAGLVTAVSAGSATITATSEGQAGTAAITVADGGQVTSAGGTITAAGGAVQIVVPAGAVTAATTVTVTENPSPPALPDLTATPATLFAVKGTSYTFGPEGTTFSAPVTVTVKYDPTRIPSWVTPGDMVLIHHNGTAWERLPGQAVDSASHTITATTTSFSPFLVAAGLAPVTLEPSKGAVNRHEISARFNAVIPGHPLTAGLRYEWTTTGENGGVGGLFLNEGQYTWTNFGAAPGVLDAVTVTVYGTVDPAVGEIRLSSAEAVVDQSLQFTYELNPDDSQVPFGGTRTLDAQMRDEVGGIYTPPGPGCYPDGLDRDQHHRKTRHRRIRITRPMHPCHLYGIGGKQGAAESAPVR
ncbi:MAG: Ig-like domain-containing protein [Gemmatimonadales bacterium]